MAIYPGASALLIPKHNRRAAVAHNRITLHQAVTNASSLHGFFSGAGVCSHFFVAESGAVEQYIDTNNRSGADLDGNDASISIETWDKANAVGEWTPAQVSAIAALVKWIVATHPSIPLRLAQDSRLGESSKGIAPHRLGVDSYPAGKPGWRVAGAMHYSNARGKTCPGDGRIAQLPGIVAMAGGGAIAVSNPVYATTPSPVAAATPAPVAQAPRRATDGNLWLDEDGLLGPATIGRWQQIMGTPIDWEISPISSLIRAVQRRVIAAGHSCGRAGADGRMGPGTIRGIQNYLGTYADGKISSPSDMVKALQVRLNASRF